MVRRISNFNISRYLTNLDRYPVRVGGIVWSQAYLILQIAYTIIVVPIAICRWSDIFGHTVPYWAIMLADSIFMLSGEQNYCVEQEFKILT